MKQEKKKEGGGGAVTAIRFRSHDYSLYSMKERGRKASVRRQSARHIQVDGDGLERTCIKYKSVWESSREFLSRLPVKRIARLGFIGKLLLISGNETDDTPEDAESW